MTAVQSSEHAAGGALRVHEPLEESQKPGRIRVLKESSRQENKDLKADDLT